MTSKTYKADQDNAAEKIDDELVEKREEEKDKIRCSNENCKCVNCTCGDDCKCTGDDCNTDLVRESLDVI